MLFGKDLNRRHVRSAKPKARALTSAQSILSLFKVEFFVNVCGEERFFIAEVRANHLQEAVALTSSYARRRDGKNFEVHRQYDMGKDRSWLYGEKNYKVKVLEVKLYDFDLYEACRKREAI